MAEITPTYPAHPSIMDRVEDIEDDIGVLDSKVDILVERSRGMLETVDTFSANTYKSVTTDPVLLGSVTVFLGTAANFCTLKDLESEDEYVISKLATNVGVTTQTISFPCPVYMSEGFAIKFDVVTGTPTAVVNYQRAQGQP